MHFFRILHFCCYLLVFSGNSLIISSVEIDNYGQYSDVLIAIDENIAENNNLLEKIEDDFKEASKALYKATQRGSGQGLSFKTIKVLVPMSWKNSDKIYKTAVSESYETSDIRIDHSEKVEDEPNTKQTGGCGDAGSYITYTDFHFLNPEQTKERYGPIKKSIVHEWSKYRWGVFSEYPTGTYPQMYLKNNEYEPVRCTKNVKGYFMSSKTSDRCEIDADNNLEPGCFFYTENSETMTKASLLSYSYLDSIEAFCDDSDDPDMQHNSDAYNQHNDLCDSKSAWAVMRQHSDFAKKYTEKSIGIPEFVYIQAQNRSIVMVMDVSGSMGNDNKLEILKSASKIFIKTFLEPSAKLGLVKFSDSVTKMETLKALNSSQMKVNYMKLIENLVAGGGTNLGDALAEGFQILGGNMSDPQKYKGNGYIMLISDGEDTVRKKYSFQQAIDIVTKSKVKVDSISIGEKTDDRLKGLSSKTGGRYLLASTSLSSTDLLEAMIKTLGNRVRNQDKIIVIDSGQIEVDGTQQNIGNIEPGSGRDTIFIFKFVSNGKSVTVYSPNKTTFNISSGSDVYHEDDNGLTISVNIPGIAEAGQWLATISPTMIRLRRSITAADSANYLAMTKTQSDLQPTYYIEGRTNCGNIAQVKWSSTCKYFIILEELGSPVKNANVTLIVTRPDQTEFTVTMFDHGAGSDIKENDGIYSASIVGKDLATAGIYNAKAITKFQSEKDNSLIERQLLLEALNNKQALPNNAVDNFPPDKIRNILGKIVDMKSREVKVSFRAVGDDGDRGDAANYDFKLDDRIIEYNKTSPKPPNEIEDINLFLKASYMSKNTCVLSVRAVDKAGNSGVWSQGFTITFDKISFAVPNKAKDDGSPLSPGAVFGIVVFAIVLIILTIAVVVYFLKNRKEIYEMNLNTIHPIKDP